MSANPPRVLDLYCGAGGASKGYALAGFDVLGVDVAPQPRYPFAFLRADVLALDVAFLREFDLIHASPPCQFTTALRFAPNARGAANPNRIPATRDLLRASGRRYIIENVEGAAAHLWSPLTLCGSMFDLGVSANGMRFQLQRHRLFESNCMLAAPDACVHCAPTIGIYGGHVRCRSARFGGRRTRDFEGEDKPRLAAQAMDIDWMTMNELSEAIPPAYTAWLGSLIAPLTAAYAA